MSIKTRLLQAENKYNLRRFMAPPLLIITDPVGQAEEIEEYKRRWPIIGLTITVLKAKEHHEQIE
ncbi:MAG: hypothetical protein Q7U88_07075 [Desulfocapsaceae bacterium]|nr:hypothetical protein [Desulfocapsaceae bacterium]